MHINNLVIRIFALTMCIILISGFLFTVAFAGPATLQEAGGTYWFLRGTKRLVVDTEQTDAKTTRFKVQTNPDYGINENDEWIKFNVNESDAYQVSVYYIDINQTKVYFKYKIGRADKAHNHNVNYTHTVTCSVNAEELGADDYITGLPSRDAIREDRSTAVNVILEKDYTYGIKFDKNVLTEKRIVTVEITDATNTGGADPLYSNIPSSYVTMRQAIETDHGLATPGDSKFKTVLLDQPTIEYILKQWRFKHTTEESESPLPVEGAVCDLMIAFGEIILYMAEHFLNIDNLTMDKIIFNGLGGEADPKIDLRGLGGLLDVTNEPVTGLLGSDTMINTIAEVYSGLRYVGIIIYTLSLLFLGVKTIMAVGTPQETKTKKYIQYWITGAAMLIFIPMFLPILPYISNKLTESLTMTGMSQFSISYIAEYLGIEFLGEDADVKNAKIEIQRRLQVLRTIADEKAGQQQHILTQAEIDAARQQVIDCIDPNTSNYHDVVNNVNKRFNEIITYINRHCDNWTNSDNVYVNALIDQIIEIVYKNGGLDQKASQDINELLNQDYPASAFGTSISGSSESSYSVFAFYVRYLYNNIYSKKGNFNYTSSNYFMWIQMALGTHGLNSSTFGTKIKAFHQACNDQIAAAEAVRVAMQDFFLDSENGYVNSAVKYEIDTLDAMYAALNTDPMATLKELAKTEHKIVYAVAWTILLFQTFALLFMYYRRLFVIIILVCIFPIVVSMYVIDKMGDGHAQSLQNWFREFFANVVIQFFHACIYVFLINIGIEICKEDPSRNWLFLIMCISFLFPAEKLLRSLVGLQSSTIEGLKTNIVGSILAMKTFGSMGKKVGVAAAHGAKKGFQGAKLLHQNAQLNGLTGVKGHLIAGAAMAKSSLRQGIEEEERKAQERRDEKNKKKQDKHDSRSKRKDMQRQAQKNAQQLDKGNRTVKDSLLAARGNVNDAVSAAKNKASSVAHTAADKVKNSKAGQAVGRAGAAVGNAAKKVGNKAGSLANKARNSKAGLAAQKFGKNAADLAHKAAGTKVGRAGLSAAKFAGQMGKYAGKKLMNNKGEVLKGLAKGYGNLARTAIAGSKAIDDLSTGGIGTALGSAAQIMGAGKGSKADAKSSGSSGSGGSSNYDSGQKQPSATASAIRQRMGGSRRSSSSSSSDGYSYDSNGAPVPSQSSGGYSVGDDGAFDVGTSSTRGSSGTETTFNQSDPNYSFTYPKDDDPISNG